MFCELNSRARKRNDFPARAVKVSVEVTVEVASSSLLFASFFFYSFSSKRVLDYASSQLGTNQYWFIINKRIQHFFVREASSPCNGNHFLVLQLLMKTHYTQINVTSVCVYSEDVRMGTGAEWVECVCGHWLHEDCIDSIEYNASGKEKLCSFCVITKYHL